MSDEIENGIRIVIENTIDNISENEWDSVNIPQNNFCIYRFLSVVEHSRVENAKYLYILMYIKKKLIATAVLSIFVVNLDLLLPTQVQSICNKIRKILKNFLKIEILICGLPVSIGKNAISISSPDYINFVIPKIVNIMNNVARQKNIRYLCFKEFPQSQIQKLSIINKCGFFTANSIPRIIMKIKWKDYDSYIASMRHGYRRQIQANLAILGSNFELKTRNDILPKPAIIVEDCTNCSPVDFHSLYMQVMNNTKVKLEVLSSEFFKLLYGKLSDEIKILTLLNDNKVHSQAILVNLHKQLIFLFIGIDYEKRDDFLSYINLLNGIVKYAIDRGYESIDLGQTSYWLKQRIGGEAEPMYFYFRALSGIKHFILKSLKNVLFAKTKLRSIRVFKNESMVF